MTADKIEYSGERAFAESVYKLYGRKIFLFSMKILREKSDAEDCVQEVMRRVVSNIDLFMSVPEEKLKLLIVKCTKNTAISIYRKLKRRREHEVQFSTLGEDTFENKNDGQAPAETAINSENASRLGALIEDLDPPRRDVIIMKYKLGMSTGDIARALGLSEHAVNMRLYRAKKALIKAGGEELYDIYR